MSPEVSTGNTFVKNSKIKFIEDESKGIYQALNLGIENSVGSFVIVVNSDDMINIADCVALCKEFEEQNVDVIYGDTFLHDDTSENIIEIKGTQTSDTIRLARMPASHQAQLIRKSEYIKLQGFANTIALGPFKMKLKYASDFDFYSRSILLYSRWAYSPRLVANQKLGGTTSKHWLRTTIEILAISFKYDARRISNLSFLVKSLLGAMRFHVPRQIKRGRDAER